MERLELGEGLLLRQGAQSLGVEPALDRSLGQAVQPADLLGRQAGDLARLEQPLRARERPMGHAVERDLVAEPLAQRSP